MARTAGALAATAGALARPELLPELDFEGSLEGFGRRLVATLVSFADLHWPCVAPLEQKYAWLQHVGVAWAGARAAAGAEQLRPWGGWSCTGGWAGWTGCRALRRLLCRHCRTCLWQAVAQGWGWHCVSPLARPGPFPVLTASPFPPAP
jgi:hypothetical protein